MIAFIFVIIGIVIGGIASAFLAPFFSNSFGVGMVIMRFFKDMGKKIQEFFENDERR